jgi:hypothetical protein
MNKTNVFCIPLLLLLLLVFWPASGIAADCDAHLSWLPSQESGHAGYKIYYGTTPGGPYPTAINVGNPSTNSQTERVHWTVTGLSCDRAYYLVSTAYDVQARESGYSREVKFGEETLPAPATRMFLIK